MSSSHLVPNDEVDMLNQTKLTYFTLQFIIYVIVDAVTRMFTTSEYVAVPRPRRFAKTIVTARVHTAGRYTLRAHQAALWARPALDRWHH